MERLCVRVAFSRGVQKGETGDERLLEWAIGIFPETSSYQELHGREGEPGWSPGKDIYWGFHDCFPGEEDHF